jgi:hypothetical protein
VRIVLIAVLLALVSSAQGLQVTIISGDGAGDLCKTSLFVNALDAAMVDCSISIDGPHVDIQKGTGGEICWEELRRIIFSP